MSQFVPNPGVPSPGINVNLGPQSIQSVAMSVPGTSWLPGSSGMNNIDAAYAAMRGGQPTQNEVTTFFPANDTLSHAYVMMPWSDNAEDLVSEGMCLFINRNIDRKGLSNVLPVFRFNQLLKERHAKFIGAVGQNGAASDEGRFQAFLNQHGDAVLCTYDRMIREKHMDVAEQMRENIPELADMYQLATQEKCLYESLLGITSRWNFLGVCISKGDATGAGSYMESNAFKQKISMAGVAVSRRANVHNLWPDGEVHVGAALYFVIRRSNGESRSAFQAEPVACFSRQYPAVHAYYYKAGSEAGMEPGRLIPVGLISECGTRFRSDPNKRLIAMGTGATNGMQAQAATVNLPQLVVQVRK